MTVYYNENDPKAAAWLRELMFEGHIPWGDVDERSIEDVFPRELAGYTQCHFFAGIGGWSYALRLAGWPDDKSVWTGSCPCQPFSSAGRRKGLTDERHLWPAWYWLISQCKPDIIFGEQVAAARDWFAIVQTDLEMESYAVGVAVLGAHSVGAPHIRQRLYWMADAVGQRRAREHSLLRPEEVGRRSSDILETARGGEVSKLADADASGWPWIRRQGKNGTAEYSYVDCRDGKRRPIEPGTFPLVNGVSGSVGLLRGYGNAIVPQVAAAFIEASGLA